MPRQALGIDDVLAFEFVSPPTTEALVAALEHLLALGALDRTGRLSSEGKLMARLPLDPAYSRAILAACQGVAPPAAAATAAAPPPPQPQPHRGKNGANGAADATTGGGGGAVASHALPRRDALR